MTMETILVVDDSALPRKLLRRILEMVGYAVVEATTLPSAVERFNSTRPAVVLLDLMLEDDVSGLDVFAALRAEHPAVCVVFATASSDDATQLLLLAAGAFAVLAKPFSASQVIATVGAALASGETPRAVRGP